MTDLRAALTRNPFAVADAIQKAKAERSLLEFIRLMWPVLEPTTPLVTGWALACMTEHLEAVSRGDIRRLLINVPPGMLKSMCGVFWTAWQWSHDPSKRFITASYAESLSLRDNAKCRRLIQSELYQRYWPHVQLLGDANRTQKFENDQTGFRLATSVGGVGTGERADAWWVDDPNSVKEAESEAKREGTNQWFSEVLSTRLNNEASAIVVIQQRAHAQDVSGLILSNDLGYEHLCLPMEFERSNRCFTPVRRADGTPPERVTRVQRDSEPIPRWLTAQELESEGAPPEYEPQWRDLSCQDRRTEDGELLFPERFSEEAVEELKLALSAHGGSYAVAGQFQQRPAPRGGGLFQRDDFRLIDRPPEGGRWVRGWDLAASTDKRSDFTVGVLLCKQDGKVYVADVRRFKAGPGEVERRIRAIAEADGSNVLQALPQDPGQAGKTQKAALGQALHGFNFKFGLESGDKQTRATPFAAQVEVGNVFLVRAPWNDAYLGELCSFPAGAHDDQVDATSRAYGELLRKREQQMIAAPVIFQAGVRL